MSKTVRIILNIFFAVLLAGGLATAYIFGAAGRMPLRCTGLNVVIADSSVNRFVSKSDIKRYLDKEYGNYVGRQLDSIDLVRVEKIIDGRSAVNKSQAFTTRDGILHVSVTQRTPIVRFQKEDGGFYADAEGFLFPLQSSYSSRVQVVDGDIPLKANSGYKGEVTDAREKEWLSEVLDVINYMEGSKVWRDKIVQITVGNGGELTLVPREGNERFLFGQPVGIEEKFRKMEMYYSHILPEKGSQAYKTVSVEYENQIVCK